MEEEEEKLLVCLLVEPGNRPAILSLKEKCRRCGREVWKALSSPKMEKIVCVDCGSLSIQVEDPANSPVTTPILCGCCGAVRGTLGELHDLARLGTDSFEF